MCVLFDWNLSWVTFPLGWPRIPWPQVLSRAHTKEHRGSRQAQLVLAQQPFPFPNTGYTHRCWQSNLFQLCTKCTTEQQWSQQSIRCLHQEIHRETTHARGAQTHRCLLKHPVQNKTLELEEKIFLEVWSTESEKAQSTLIRLPSLVGYANELKLLTHLLKPSFHMQVPSSKW